MRTIGLKPEDRVLLIERRGEQQLVHNGLVTHLSLNETLAGEHGETAIGAVMVIPLGRLAFSQLDQVIQFDDVVHISHRDWREGRTAIAYEELPPMSGVCRFCGCTERRACNPPCNWVDPGRTVCSAQRCVEKLHEVMAARLAEIGFAVGSEVRQ